MTKKKIYELSVEAFMNSGDDKESAISKTAKKAGKKYSTVERAMRGRKKKVDKTSNRLGKRILYVPDTQIKVGSTTEHIRACARRAVEKEYDIIVLAGDWHDMPSLSVFNSKRSSEGLRVADDIKVGNDALDEFMAIINTIPKKRRPEIHITLGNHSCKVRIERFFNDNPQLIGMIEDTGTSHFEKHGIEVHDFLDILEIEGIRFSHYITNPHSLKGSLILTASKVVH